MENSNMPVICSTAYFPPVEYFYELNKYRIIYIDSYENYIKQTYRNRCEIFGANGKLSLSIPVIKTTGNHTLVKDLEIDNDQPWQNIHWHSIESAYNSSPFFLYYRDQIEVFFQKKYKFLLDLNTEIIQYLLKQCKISCEIKFTVDYIKPSNEIIDYRNEFTPKKSEPNYSFPGYTQVFSEKHGFIKNLSILDLLFNEGKFTADYLQKIKPIQ
jgi:hypothetical protein